MCNAQFIMKYHDFASCLVCSDHSVAFACCIFAERRFLFEGGFEPSPRFFAIVMTPVVRVWLRVCVNARIERVGGGCRRELQGQGAGREPSE